MKLGQKRRTLHMRFISRARLRVNRPGIAATHRFSSHQVGVVSLGSFMNELAPLFGIFLCLPLTLLARFFGLVLALVDDLLNLFFFLGCIFGVERLIVFLDQSLNLLAIEFHHFVRLYVGGPNLSLSG